MHLSWCPDKTWTDKTWIRLSREWGRGVSYPGPREIWEALPSPRNIKCTRMHHFEKNSKIFSAEDPTKRLGDHKNVSTGPVWLSTDLNLDRLI